jgi:hypothetical protein
VLRSLAGVQAKFTAAHAAVLGRFDAADAHDGDGYGNSAAWLMAMAGMTRRDARAEVWQMRLLRDHPALAAALGAGDISRSWALAIAEWTKKLPAELRAATIKILVQAAASGACLDDLRVIAGVAEQNWRAQQPDGGEDGFDDRYVQAGTTFGGAGVIRGDLTPECAAAVQAVLDALGKKAGPEDVRTEGQRFHDALQAGCELLIRAKMVPDRAGAGTQVIAHIALSQLRGAPGGSELEDAVIRARLGDGGYLAGKDAAAVGCDAQVIPVVTGHADMTVIDKIIVLALAAAHPRPGQDPAGPAGPAAPAGAPEPGLSPRAWQALRYAVARLAVDFVSGPSGIAAALRTGLLQPPYSTPSLPLDIGHSSSIPAGIRRAVQLRDRGCAWPRCGRPAAWCDVHHLHHKKDGGKTAVSGCVLLCQFHHDVCIHRWGWRLILHPDGTTTAYGPQGQVLHSHSPPTLRAG